MSIPCWHTVLNTMYLKSGKRCVAGKCPAPTVKAGDDSKNIFSHPYYKKEKQDKRKEQQQEFVRKPAQMQQSAPYSDPV